MVPQVATYRARSMTLAHGTRDAPVCTHTATHAPCAALYAATHAPCAAVLYTSDLTAYSNMYMVEIGSFDELPDLE